MALIFCLCSVQFFATLWITVRQASLSITVSRSSLKPRSIESVMPSSHLILCRPLLPCHQSLFMLPRDNFCSLELLLLMLLSHFSCVWLCVTPYTAAHQAPRPWDSPGKNTGVGCHFLLQCIKVKSESKVAQLCPTLSDPMDRSLPGSSTHGIFQARVLEWVASAFSVELLIPY